MSRDAVLLDGRLVRLDPRALLGEGGEGRVYRHDGRALKVLTDPTPARAAKLAAFTAYPLPRNVTAPLALCLDPDTREVVGYAMRAVEGGHAIASLARRPFREAHAAAKDVLAIFRELATTVRTLHSRGVVVGDLNDGNVLVTLPAAQGAPLAVDLIDADSLQLPRHPCVVAHERFLDPRLYGTDLAEVSALSRETDAYALAVLLFASLTCVHPFGGTHPSHATLLRRAEARVSVLSPGVKLPKAAFPPQMLPDAALAFFEGVFERDARDGARLVPDDLLELPFARCSCGLEHARRACPACTTVALVRPTVRARGAVRASSVTRAAPGLVLAAEVNGGALATLVRDARGLVREDGTTLPAEITVAPGARVRLAGASTWVIGPTHAVRVVPGGAPERVPVTFAPALGEPAADAGPAGLVLVDGDTLVRATDGTRIGQVLGGQTWVRVGARLGFAFYRAGAVTVAFVFDVAKGPLRQLEVPPLAGRLVAAHATFDDAHVLFRVLTEVGGRRKHVAHLFDTRGTRLASAAGDELASPLFAGGDNLESACLAGGAVLAATPEGLALLRADPSARVFETRRVFPDAKDFASPDAAMLVGPGGSVYVRSHDEVVHLGFTEAGGKP